MNNFTKISLSLVNLENKLTKDKKIINKKSANIKTNNKNLEEDSYVNDFEEEFNKLKKFRLKPNYKKIIIETEKAKNSLLPKFLDSDSSKLKDRFYSPEAAALWSLLPLSIPMLATSMYVDPVLGMMTGIVGSDLVKHRRDTINKDYEDAIRQTGNSDLTVGEWKKIRRKEELKQKLLEEAEKKSFHKLAGIINRMEKKLKLV